MTTSDIDRVAELCSSLGCQFQLVAGEKRFVVSVISVCEILLLQGPCAYFEENGQESHVDVSATRSQTSLSRYNLRAVAYASSPVTHVLRSPLCEARRETKRLRRRLLMYYLAGRYPNMLNFAVP